MEASVALIQSPDYVKEASLVVYVDERRYTVHGIKDRVELASALIKIGNEMKEKG